MSDILTPSPQGDSSEESEVGEVKLLGNGRAGKWFENFWYHYKFQTLAAIFLLVAIIICVVQCAARPAEPIFNICYAGPLNLGTAMSGDVPTQLALKDTLSAAAGTIAEEDDDETISELISVYGYTINDASEHATVLELSRQNKENLKAELNAANAYLFLLAEPLYTTYAFSPEDRVPYMVPVAAYLPTGAHSLRVTADGYGVYLSSTPLAEAEGFRDLPEDTILCLRTSFSLFHASNRQEDLYRQNEALFRAMLDGSFR